MPGVTAFGTLVKAVDADCTELFLVPSPGNKRTRHPYVDNAIMFLNGRYIPRSRYSRSMALIRWPQQPRGRMATAWRIHRKTAANGRLVIYH